jgi:hypothetical protein
VFMSCNLITGTHSAVFLLHCSPFNVVYLFCICSLFYVYLNKEVTVRFEKLKMQLWDSMC